MWLKGLQRRLSNKILFLNYLMHSWDQNKWRRWSHVLRRHGGRGKKRCSPWLAWPGSGQGTSRLLLPRTPHRVNCLRGLPGWLSQGTKATWGATLQWACRAQCLAMNHSFLSRRANSYFSFSLNVDQISSVKEHFWRRFFPCPSPPAAGSALIASEQQRGGSHGATQLQDTVGRCEACQAKGSGRTR